MDAFLNTHELCTYDFSKFNLAVVPTSGPDHISSFMECVCSCLYSGHVVVMVD